MNDNLVLPLVGTQHHLFIVKEIGQQRWEQKDSKRCIYIPQRQIGLREHERQQCHHHYSSNTDKTSHTSIEPSLQSDNLIDAAFVMLLQRFVECVSDSRTYSQFRQVENPQKILSGSIQAQNLHAQIFQENFSGYKADNEAKHAIHEPHLSIKYTGRGTRLRHITYILQFHGLQEKSTNIMQFGLLATIS